MNKSILICILIILISCQNQPTEEAANSWFRGSVEYAYTYESDSLDVDSLTRVRPHTGLMKFEDINYKSTFTGTDTLHYIYSGKLNKCYSFTGKGNDEECEDYSVFTDSILSFRVYDTTETVLGQECRVLEFQSKYFWNRYFVSKQLLLNPGAYENHNAYNWKFYGDQTNGGLILKLEHRFKSFTMKGEAVELANYPPDSKHIDIEKAEAFCNL